MPAPPQSRGFRHDINGLRAIAVISVVLFHFAIPGFSGGFVGVDVFFVISGFLMTAILVKGLERLGTDRGASNIGSLLWRFYVSRARRIVPALLVLVLILMVAGWWALPRLDYESLSKHSVAALGFFSNIIFWLEAGYFDAASHEKWLLHTWSLSVEWQFYLLLPLMLIAIWIVRPGRRTVAVVLALVAVASLLCSVWLTQRSPSAAFFLLPTRAWQMLAGGLVFLAANRFEPQGRMASLMEYIGLASIGLAIALFDADSAWPSANAVLPVAGTMLVLLANRQSPWTRNGLVQWLGLSSYSIYLWHWPFFVALVFLELATSPLAIAAGIALSLVLGGLSYQLVEKFSIGWLGRGGLIKGPAAIAVCTLAVAVPAYAIFKDQGVSGRMPEAVALAASEETNINPRRSECHHNDTSKDFPWCTFGGSDIKAVVVGDSHAASVVTAVQAAVENEAGPDAGVLYASHSSCPTLFGIHRDESGWHCSAFNEFIARKIDQLPESVPVIVVNTGSYTQRHDPVPGRATVYFSQPRSQIGYDGYLNEFRQAMVDSACRLAHDRHVYLMRPIPRMEENVPRVVARRLLFDNGPADVRISRAEYKEEHSIIWEAQDQAARACDVSILDPTQYYCDGKFCYGSDRGRPLYYDRHHLSEYGNRRLVGMFFDTLNTARGTEHQHADASSESAAKADPGET